MKIAFIINYKHLLVILETEFPFILMMYLSILIKKKSKQLRHFLKEQSLDGLKSLRKSDENSLDISLTRKLELCL